MKKNFLEKEQSLTISALVLAIITIVAQLFVLANVIKLISRGNKALKIYINKNKHYNKLCKGNFEEDNSEKDISF